MDSQCERRANASRLQRKTVFHTASRAKKTSDENVKVESLEESCESSRLLRLRSSDATLFIRHVYKIVTLLILSLDFKKVGKGRGQE